MVCDYYTLYRAAQKLNSSVSDVSSRVERGELEGCWHDGREVVTAQSVEEVLLARRRKLKPVSEAMLAASLSETPAGPRARVGIRGAKGVSENIRKSKNTQEEKKARTPRPAQAEKRVVVPSAKHDRADAQDGKLSAQPEPQRAPDRRPELIPAPPQDPSEPPAKTLQEPKSSRGVAAGDASVEPAAPRHIPVPHASNLRSLTVLFSGQGPYGVEDLTRLLPAEVRRFEHKEAPRGIAADVLVLGRRGFSPDAVQAAIRKRGARLRILPQEGFVDEVLFGRDWWKDHVDRLNAVLEHHPGLRYVRSQETFRWPNTDAPESVGEVRPESYDFRPETELHVLGYRITGRTREQRWRVLVTVAVPRLGLKEVAETIAGHCKGRKRQRNGRERFSYAIAEWEHDLDRLKRELYPGHRPRFAWPTADP
ncbi:MAG: hypothetical protein M3R38_15755 [Actinomycetota bacterium]|nr:hypothetical protein [Actinomycetota bacterium]